MGRDVTGLHKNKNEFPVEIGLSPVQTDEGKFVLASIIDITDRKKIAKDLLAAKQGYRGKIVALTAHTLSDELERCLQSGFDDHIGKPVNRNVLIERIDRLSRQKKTS